MKNIAKNFLIKLLGGIFIKTGEMGLDSCCIGFEYEPEIPEELKK